MKLIKNINQLLVTGNFDTPLRGAQQSILPYISDAYLIIDKGYIFDYGKMSHIPKDLNFKETIDADGCIVCPSWCDSHTHLVYAQSREEEFDMRIKGATYQEIAAAGGGILNSANKLSAMPEDVLFEKAKVRLKLAIEQGTGAIEIKTGYGLSLAAEHKMLRVINRLKTYFDIPIKATLLAAHAVPEPFKSNPDHYISHIIEEMLPLFTNEGLVDFIDIFCEKGYFSTTQMDRLLTAAKKYNLQPKVHVNQFTSLGGIQTAVNHNALSVDHLEVLTDSDIQALKNSNTIATALPGCSFFLGIPYTNTKQLIDHSIPVAIATDYNPGSAPSSNMNFTLSQACINLKMTPDQAILSATINGAFAMGVAGITGSITKGKLANLIITKPLKSYKMLPYYFGANNIKQVVIKGEINHVA